MRARELADQLDGRLCTTADEADALLADLSTVPPLEADALASLGALADRVQTAQRIVDRTVDRAAEAVSIRLAATGTGIAVHPAAVRGRAARVTTARELAAVAEERLRAGEAESERASAEGAAGSAPDQTGAAEPAATVEGTAGAVAMAPSTST